MNPQCVGKYFLIILINKDAIPAKMANVIKRPSVKTKANKTFFNIQNENKEIKTTIAPKVKRRAFLGFCKFSSPPLKTSKGDTYQVPSNGSKANNTDIKTPNNIPIIIG